MEGKSNNRNSIMNWTITIKMKTKNKELTMKTGARMNKRKRDMTNTMENKFNSWTN